MAARKNQVPLITEEHPDNYSGYPFITLIQYRDDDYLSIVDNFNKKIIGAYILDLCSAARVDEKQLISVAVEWYNNNRENFPISIEMSRRGMIKESHSIYRTFNVDYVKRVIGPLPQYKMTEVVNIRRRRKKGIPSGVEVKRNVLTF